MRPYLLTHRLIGVILAIAALFLIRTDVGAQATAAIERQVSGQNGATIPAVELTPLNGRYFLDLDLTPKILCVVLVYRQGSPVLAQ